MHMVHTRNAGERWASRITQDQMPLSFLQGAARADLKETGLQLFIPCRSLPLARPKSTAMPLAHLSLHAVFGDIRPPQALVASLATTGDKRSLHRYTAPMAHILPPC